MAEHNLPEPGAAGEESDPRIGTQFGRYRIIGVLGRGGMGVVYEALDPATGGRVAIKLLPDEFARDADALGRFQLEGRSASKVRHPNAVGVLEVGQEGKSHYMVMEVVRGGSAKEFVEGRGAFNWPEATRVIADACRGLAAAHAAGLIHRDIKPANIMRSHDGVVKLADFGLAKATDGSQKSITATGNVVGTPQYMSPEQCRAEKLDERSDIYSLGATYYVLLTGRTPYHKAGSTPQMMYAHCYEPVPDPRDLVPTIPERCVLILQRAMAKDPADRYPTAAAMLASLDKVLAGTADVVTEKTPDWNDFLAAADELRQKKASAGGGRKPPDSPARKAPSGQGAHAPRPSKARSSPLPLVFGATFAVVILAVVGWLAFRGKGKPDSVGKDAKTDAVAADPATRDDRPPDPPPTINDPRPNPTPPTKTEAPAPGETDLLKLIDPARHAVSGEWKFDGSALSAPNASFARLQVPVAPPEEYDLELTVAKTTPRGSLNIGLFMGGRPFVLVLDGWGDSVSGLEAVDGNTGNNNETTHQGRLLTPSRPAAIRCSVRRGGVTVLCDGAPIVDWKGDAERLSLARDWGLPAKDQLFLGAWDGSFTISRMVIRPVPGAGRQPPTGEPARPGNAIDLLSLIDPAKDAVFGTWSRTAGGDLASSGDTHAGLASESLEIPYRPPAEYDFRIEFTRTAGTEAVVQIFRMGDKQLLWCMGGWADRVFGFDTVDGLPASESPTKVERPGLLKPGGRYTAELRVRRDGTTAFLNGQRMTALPAGFKTAALPGNWPMRSADALGVGSFRSATTFHKIEVVEISGRGTLTRPDDPAAKAAEAKRSAAAGGVDDPARWKNAIDLLALADPAQDATWPARADRTVARGAGGLVLTGPGRVQVEFPFRPPAEYDFRGVVSFDGAPNWSLSLVHPRGPFTFKTMGEVGGFETVDGHDVRRSPYSRPVKALAPGVRHTVLVTVRRDRIAGYIDGGLVAELPPDKVVLDVHSDWKMRAAGLPGFGAAFCTATLHSTELLEISGRGAFTRPDDPAAKAAEAKRGAGTAAAEVPTDALALIDPDKHTRNGQWTKADGALTNARTLYACIELPIVPAASYRIEAAVQRAGDPMNDLVIGLPVGSSEVALKLEAFGDRRLSGLDRIGTEPLGQGGPSHNRPVFKPGGPTAVRIDVSPRRVVAECDGVRVAEWEGDPSELSAGDAAGFRARPHTLWLGSWNARFRISKLTYSAASAGGGVKGRYVRIDLPGYGKYLALAEVEVLAGGVNVARKGKASQSSVFEGGVPERAIDGETKGDFNLKAQTTHTRFERSPWWEVDLGVETPVETIVVWNRTDGQPEVAARLAGFTLTVLDADRKPVFTKAGNPAPAPSLRFDLGGTSAGNADMDAVRWVLGKMGEYQITGEKAWRGGEPPAGPFTLSCVRMTVSGKHSNDAGLALLARCRDLVHFEFWNSGITDRGLEHLAGCPQATGGGPGGKGLLRYLTIEAPAVTDIGVSHIGRFTGLRHLGLKGTKTTDAGLAFLHQLTNLEFVHLAGTKVTADGVRKLSAALPKCRIEWDGGIVEPSASAEFDLPAELLAENAWGRFGAGSWVKTKTEAVIGGQKTTVPGKTTLAAAAGDKFTIESESPAFKSPARGDLQRGQLVLSTGTAAAYSEHLKKYKGAVRRLPDETITIAGRRIATKVLEIAFEIQGKRMAVKLWVSGEVPGAIARRTEQFDTVQSTTEVTEFEARPAAGAWIPLFNGKDLAGWSVPENQAAELARFSAVVSAGGPAIRSTAGDVTLNHAGPVGDYHLRLEFSAPAVARPGFIAHYAGRRACDFRPIHGAASLWNGRTGDAAEVRDGRFVGIRPVKALETFPVPPDLHSGWHRLDVIALGDAVGWFVDGRLVHAAVTLRDPPAGSPAVTKGLFGLTARDGEVHFRKIEYRRITALPEEFGGPTAAAGP